MKKLEKEIEIKKINIYIYIYIWLSTYGCAYTYHKIALERQNLKEDSVSASLKDVSKRSKYLN